MKRYPPFRSESSARANHDNVAPSMSGMGNISANNHHLISLPSCQIADLVPKSTSNQSRLLSNFRSKMRVASARTRITWSPRSFGHQKQEKVSRRRSCLSFSLLCLLFGTTLNHETARICTRTTNLLSSRKDLHLNTSFGILLDVVLSLRVCFSLGCENGEQSTGAPEWPGTRSDRQNKPEKRTRPLPEPKVPARHTG